MKNLALLNGGFLIRLNDDSWKWLTFWATL